MGYDMFLLKVKQTHQGLLKQLGLPQVPLAINFIVQVVQNWDVPPKPLVNTHRQKCFDILIHLDNF